MADTDTDTDVVRPITQEILGMNGPGNLIGQIIPAISVIAQSTFRPHDVRNQFDFRTVASTVARLGIFAAKKGTSERAVILLLPKDTNPDAVLICITQGFQQAHLTLDPLGWSHPLSPDLIKFCLLKHVINRWGAQTLASRKNLALVYIVRAKGHELGPFAKDGPFVRKVLTEMVALTNNAFSFDSVEAFTFSSGISDFNPFLGAIAPQFNIRAVYSIDPAGAAPTAQLPQATRKQYLSGQTGGPRPGFEFMPVDRWQNEDKFDDRRTFANPWQFNYMHNWCMPMYVLNLALNT